MRGAIPEERIRPPSKARLPTMISRAAVDDLRARPPTPESPVLSVYLDVDQSQPASRNRHFEAALKTRLRGLEQQLVESERDLFRADAARVQRFVADYTPRARTLVLFADDSAHLLWSGEVQLSLPADARWEATPYLRPLLEALDEHQRYGIVLADKERARIFTVFLGEIEEEREAFAAWEIRHKKSSGSDHQRSDMHFQRQDDLHARWNLRHVAELMEQVARERAFDRLVLAGPVEATGELGRLLPHPLRERVIGTLRMQIDAPVGDVLRQTLEIAERAERQAENALVTQLFDRGAVGLEATLAALQQGRLMILVHADGVSARGRECPRCHALFADGAESGCAYCGEHLRSLDDLIGRAAARAGEVGGRVEQVRGEAADRLQDVGGIGALLRF